jgi:UDP-2,3-diacylglucosamine pyrophosphatase LpxH
MQTFIISDLHLGLKNCRADDFLEFLKELPDGAGLILNGDTITHFYSDATLNDEHKAVVRRLRDESFRREIIWLRGNNDKRIVLSDPGNIIFARDFSIGKRLYITHGDRFDWIMPSTRAILIPIRLVYYSIAKIKKSKKHVAEYAKKFSGLYSILCRHVAWNAARYARRNGYEAVTCGHTHYSEERTISGIRYLNTGCWTESDNKVVIVNEENITLQNP